MAELVRGPEIERLQDPMDTENTSWAGVEINFHVKPGPGEPWAPDLTAGCLVNGEPAVVPGAVSALRQWDKDPQNSFYCYAPVGYLRNGTRLTLQVKPTAKPKSASSGPLWQGEFIVGLVNGKYHLEEIVSLSKATPEQLTKLPGVGPKTAEAIVGYRENHGPFGSIDQLRNVPMIGLHKLAALRKRLMP